jgi:uncharacterized protein YkwD
LLAAGIVAVTCAQPITAARQDRDSLNPSTVVELTNQSRKQARLPPVRVNGQLTAAADAKLADMLKRNYFGHVSPDGNNPWDFMKAAGYDPALAGENLGRGYKSAKDLQKGWMNSREHRANILRRQFRDIGVAAAGDVVVVMFGVPFEEDGK